MKLEMKVTIAFALGLLIIVAGGIGSYIGIQQVAETSRMVTRSHEVLEKLEHLLLLVKDAETSQRGFVQTGEERYLEQYISAADEIRKEIDLLGSLTKENPTQHQSIRLLAEISREKLDELQQTIRLRREGGLNAVLPFIRSNRDKRSMDDLRTVIGQIDGRERQLLDKHNRVAGAVALHTSWMVGIGFILSLLVLSIVAIVITRALRLSERGTTPEGAIVKWPDMAIRYVFALIMVALAMVVRHWLVSTFGPLPTFVIFYPAILLVATIAGGGPGIMATILSVLAAAYWYFPPYDSFAVNSPNDAIALGIFGGASLFLSLLAERMHRARWAEAVSVTQEQELALLDMGNLLTLDLVRRIVHWSEGCCRLYGFSAQEAQGQMVDELLRTRSPQPLEQIHRELLEQGHWEGELTRCGKDGTELSLMILLALRRDEQGKPSAILEVSTDITRQKSAEAALRESEARLQTANDDLQVVNEELQAQSEELQAQNEELAQLMEECRQTDEALRTSDERHRLLAETMLQGVVHQDANGEIIDMNPAAERILGKNREQFLGSSSVHEEHHTIRENGEHFPGMEHPSMVALRTGLPVRGVIMGVINPKIGDYRWISIDAVPLFTPGETRPSEVYTVFEDITERKQAGDALADAKNKLEQECDILQAVMDGAKNLHLVYLDRDFNFVRVNETYAQTCGFRPEQMFGKNHFALYPHAENEAIFMRARDIGEPVAFHDKPFEFPDQPERGVTYWDWSLTPVKDTHGRVSGLVFSLFETTDRKRAEDALRESEQFNKAVLDTAGSLVVVLDMEGRIRRFNQACEAATGYSAADVLGRVFWEFLVPNEDLDGVRLTWESLQAGDFPNCHENHWIAKDGTRRLITWTNTAIVRNDKPEYIIGTGLDITERKKAEEALRNSERLYRAIGESIDYGVWVCDPDGRNTYASESFLKLVGLTQEQCSNFGWGEVLHPDDAERTISAWKECVRTGGNWDIEHRFRSVDGEWRPILARGVPVRNERGEVVSWAGINLDISRMKRAEEMLKKLNEELESRVEERTAELREKDQLLLSQSRQAAMGEMIGNIAHQWRQPLNVLGMTVQQLLLFYDLGEFNREFLEKNVSQSMELIRHMSKTIDDFRNYFRPDKEKVAFKVNGAIANTLFLIAESFKNQKIGIEVVAKEDPVIFGYQNEFAQVLLNILNNARDILTERGIGDPKVTITVCSEGDRAVVTVSDNAGGVPEEIMDRVFDPYFTTKGPQGGTGVGLYMSKSIIEKNMGGRLTLRNIAEGAEFRIEV